MILDQFDRPIAEAEPDVPSGVTDVNDFGHMISDVDLMKGLKSLSPCVHFDMGGNLNLHHPRIDEWQGVFYNGLHICSMSRGLVPEYDVWYMDKSGERTHIKQIGWRGTFEILVRKRLPGINWDALCAKFGIDKKHYHDHYSTLAAGAV